MLQMNQVQLIKQHKTHIYLLKLHLIFQINNYLFNFLQLLSYKSKQFMVLILRHKKHYLT